MYSIEDKIIIKDRIEELKSKKHKIEIMKVIKKDKNFNINEVSESGTGILLYFNKFTDDTYKNIENYLNDIKNNAETELNFSSILSNTESEFYNDPANKFNNKEKQFIKRNINNMSSS